MKRRFTDIAFYVAWFLGCCLLVGFFFDDDLLQTKVLIEYTITGIIMGLFVEPVRRKFKEMVMPKKKA